MLKISIQSDITNTYQEANHWLAETMIPTELNGGQTNKVHATQAYRGWAQNLVKFPLVSCLPY